MQLHPAVAFAAALAGGSINGLIGAFMALPAAAVIQATVSTYLTRHEVVESDLTREDAQPDETSETPGNSRNSNGIRAKLTAKLRRDAE
jgi:hypothetical protein